VGGRRRSRRASCAGRGSAGTAVLGREPVRATSVRVDAMALYAGTSVGDVVDIRPAGRIVEETDRGGRTNSARAPTGSRGRRPPATSSRILRDILQLHSTNASWQRPRNDAHDHQRTAGACQAILAWLAGRNPTGISAPKRSPNYGIRPRGHTKPSTGVGDQFSAGMANCKNCTDIGWPPSNASMVLAQFKTEIRSGLIMTVER